MSLIVYGDYVCGDSFRLKVWLDRVAEHEPIEVEWRPFSLKESKRLRENPELPSMFVDPGLESFSILALALEAAAKEADFKRYHDAMYEAMHREHRLLGRDEIFEIATQAGVNIKRFRKNADNYLEAVIAHHQEAAQKWGAFGTPTVVIDGSRSYYLETVEPPETPREAAAAWNGVLEAAAYPYLRELRRAR